MHKITFSEQISSLLTQFRQSVKTRWPDVLTDHLPNSHLKKIERKNLKKASDPMLYDAAIQVIKSIQTQHHNAEMVAFSEKLKTTLSEYTLNQSHQIIHKKKTAAHAHIQAIQLLSTEKKALKDPQTIKTLKKYNQIILNYGTTAQIEHLLKCLEKNRYKNNYALLIEITQIKSAL